MPIAVFVAIGFVSLWFCVSRFLPAPKAKRAACHAAHHKLIIIVTRA